MIKKQTQKKANKVASSKSSTLKITAPTRKNNSSTKKTTKSAPSKKIAKPSKPIKKQQRKPSIVKGAPKSKKITTAQHQPPKTISKELLIHAYHEMLRSRLVDQKIITLYKQNKCHFQIGAAGHEAVQVAAAQVFRAGKDWFYPYYRDMALCAALGMTNEDFILNAMNKHDDPNSHGRMMPMHYGSLELNIVNQSSPTGSQFLQAVGVALAAKLKKLDEVVYVSAGEGTCAQGDFHEAVNWAAREKLPIIFLIQNNGFAISVPVEEQLAGNSVYKMVAGYENLARYEVDGTDFSKSYHTLREAYLRAASGYGPAVIEAHVPRLQSHSISDNHLKYRTAEDIARETKRDPILNLASDLIKKKYATKASLKEMEESLLDQINEAADWAEQQPDPDPAEATSQNFSTNRPWDGIYEKEAEGEEVYLVDAINHALAEELAHNKDTFIFGQDVAGGKGGVFTVTAGLTEKFGKDRVFNGPLAESSLVGVGIGMATVGLKPIVEVQFGDYIWTGANQIRNEMAMMRYRSNGDFSCPLVLRIPIGGYIHGGVYHSQNIEATFSHFPGLFIALPSNATDAKGMLKAAIRGNDPVLFLEHKGLYRQVFAKGKEGGPDDLVPLGKAKIVRPGSDLTIISYGALLHRSVTAANLISEEDGLDIEVIDLRSIVPLDLDTIFNSIRKTNRALIVHEDMTFMGFGAEIAAQISESCFEHLDAPLGRVGMKYAACVPHAPVLEGVILPQQHDIVVAARRVLSY